MKIKVYLSCCIDLTAVDGVKPLCDISKSILEDESLWDNLSEGYPIYAKKCVVKQVEDNND